MRHRCGAEYVEEAIRVACQSLISGALLRSPLVSCLDSGDSMRAIKPIRPGRKRRSFSQFHQAWPCARLGGRRRRFYFDFRHRQNCHSLRGRSLTRFRRPQIPQVQQVAGDFRQEARRLPHGLTASPGRRTSTFSGLHRRSGFPFPCRKAGGRKMACRSRPPSRRFHSFAGRIQA